MSSILVTAFFTTPILPEARYKALGAVVTEYDNTMLPVRSQCWTEKSLMLVI